MDNEFVTPETLADYLSLPVEVIEDLSSSGIITQDCYFEIGEHRRYLVSKVTDILLEYTKENYRNNVKYAKNNKKNSEEPEDRCEKLKFTLQLLVGLTYSLAKYIDDLHVKFDELVNPLWDDDFKTSIMGAWRKEIESILQLNEQDVDVKRNINVVISEIKKFEKETNFDVIYRDAVNLIPFNSFKYSEEIFSMFDCLQNSKYDASIIIDWINEVNLKLEKLPKDFKSPWNLYISKES